MSARDPGRLLDPGSELDPSLRALLESGRNELPSSARLDQMAARLGPHFTPAQTTGVGKVMAGGAGLPRLILSLVLAGVGSAVYLAVRDADRAPSAALSAPSSRVIAAAPTRSSEPAVTGATNPSPVQQPAPRPESSVATAAQPRATAPRAPRLEPARVKAPPTDRLGELALLDEAQSALGTAPALALARTETHAHRYVHGEYEQEREILAIEALLRLGRGRLAQLRAERFLERFVGSSYATRARQQLARARD